MAPSFVSAAAVLIVMVLANHGAVLNVEDVTKTLTTDLTIVGSVIVMFRQWYTGKATWFGARPN